MSNITDITNINGPINLIRLEGKVNNIPKILYAFGDLHIKSSEQTQCDNLFSLDISQYLAFAFRNINNNNIIYDFFVESYNKPFKERDSVVFNKQQKYISNVVTLFFKNFNIIENKKKTFSNVRFHHIDTRYQLFQLYDHVKNLDNYLQNIEFELFREELKKISLIVENFSKYISHKLNDTDFDYNLLSTHKELKLFTNTVNKIFNKYDNNNVKNIIHTILNTYIEPLIQNVINSAKLLKSQINYVSTLPQIDTKNYDHVDNLIDELLVNINIFYAFIMDMFFIRRIVDKNYITHCISYTGINHSLFISYILIKFFDFKISHVAYSSIKNIDDLNNTIKNTDATLFTRNAFNKYFYPSPLIQCIDITNFPKNFS